MKKFSLRGIALNRSHLSNAVRRVMLFAEVVVLTAMLVYTWKWFYNAGMPVPIYRRGYYAMALFYGVFLLLCMKALKGRTIGEKRLFDLIVSQSIALLLCNVTVYFPLALLSYRLFHPGWLLLMSLVQICVIIWWCFLCNRLFFYLFRPLEMLYIADEPENSRLLRVLEHYWERYHIRQSLPVSASPEELEEALKSCHAVLLDTADRDTQDRISMECFRRNLYLFLVPTPENVILNSARQLHLVDTPLLSTDSHRLGTFDLFLKRCMDVACSALGLLITLPVTLCTALAVRLGDGGPVFFTQERLTKNGRVFRLVKFRTMVVDAEKDGQRLATRNDQRITPVGAVLRKTRLDELPQLWNVLKGEMSLVGPRPECPAIAEEVEKTLPEFAYRLKVKAGITGMAQVYGSYDTTPRDKLLMDMMYIESYSASLDVKLLLLTIRTLFLTDKTRGVEMEDET